MLARPDPTSNLNSARPSLIPNARKSPRPSSASPLYRISPGYNSQLSGSNLDTTFSYKKVKASSYIAQYPVLRTIQSALHFTSLTDLFNQTPSRLLWEASSHMLQLMREGCSYTYPPLSIASYSFIQLSELEQCRVKELAKGFNTAAQDSNQGSRSRESEALPLNHCALLRT